MIFFKDGKNAFKAMKARIFINKQLIKSRKFPMISARILAWLFLGGLAIALLGGASIKTGLTSLLFPDMNFMLLHSRLIYVLPVLLLLHIITMKVAYAPPKALNPPGLKHRS